LTRQNQDRYQSAMDDLHPDVIPALRTILEPDEEVKAAARATDAVLAVTDRRVVVKTHLHVELDIPVERVRRIQFDIERRRAATLVIVPDDPSARAQVLAIPPEEVRRVAAALTVVAERFASLS
jgi:hypothetical protein